jgi:hypothetical protein
MKSSTMKQPTKSFSGNKFVRRCTGAFKRNLRKSIKEDELIEMFSMITGKKMPPKRVGSSQLDAELERLSERKKKWAAIINLTSQAKSLHDAYVLNGDGEIAKLKDVVEDKDLLSIVFDRRSLRIVMRCCGIR